MENLRDFASGGAEYQADGEPEFERPPEIGTDERRMHVRAYNYWVSLLSGRAYPSIEDLDPASINDFGPHSVLLDFTQGPDNPGIAFLGAALRLECGLGADIETIDDVPSRSLLSRLTDHYLQIIANRAPIGFEAEFVNVRGNNTFYRGILMPFSSDGDTIDFIYGVINWKEVADTAEVSAIEAAVERSIAATPRGAPAVPVWADGPHTSELDGTHADRSEDEDVVEPADDGSLADWLAAARDSADIARNARVRSRAALYRALGLAYDFALVADARGEEFAELLEDTGIVAQERAPMTPLVKLVFGVDYDKTRLTEFAAALSFGRRQRIAARGFTGFLETHAGGLKGVVAAERAARRPERPVRAASPRQDKVRDRARAIEPKGMVRIAGDEAEFVVLVARRIDADTVAVLGSAPGDDALLDRALKRLVG